MVKRKSGLVGNVQCAMTLGDGRQNDESQHGQMQAENDGARSEGTTDDQGHAREERPAKSCSLAEPTINRGNRGATPF